MWHPCSHGNLVALEHMQLDRGPDPHTLETQIFQGPPKGVFLPTTGTEQSCKTAMYLLYTLCVIHTVSLVMFIVYWCISFYGYLFNFRKISKKSWLDAVCWTNRKGVFWKNTHQKLVLARPCPQSTESHTSKWGLCVRGNNGLVTHEGLCFVANIQLPESP